ncbi:hypothetical protein CHS0354_005293 [Potamilus streckersoni]|uniref:TIR domain-containing protein n=1 Tax=Potamilus streckersoni TaxID=2493646 RepID=A0AAE0VW54_9BIVA|nr:hypothetical protein CHS0354_005293 [Potamilus streckersoni]
MENLSLCFFLLLALPNAARVCIFYVSENVCKLCDCVSDGMTVSVNCENRRLMNVPGIIHSNATSLDLRTNCIRKLQNNSFTGLHHLKKLDLSNNKIDLIEIGTFWPLTALEELRLKKTNLGLLQRALRPGIFRGLTNLKTLNLQNNVQQSIANASRLPDKTFSDLDGLENLQIDGVYTYRFGPGFENLTNFKTLVMSGWDGYCEMVRLESQVFMNVSYLQNLNIINCELNYIDPDAFRPLKNLQTLNLSDNSALGFQNFGRLLGGLNDSSARILNVTSIVSPYGDGSRLSLNHVQQLNMTRLEELYMDKNAIEVIDYGVLSQFPPTLRKLHLRQNRLVFTLFMYEIFNLGNLNVFDAGNQQPSKNDDDRWGRKRRSVEIRRKSFPTFRNRDSLNMMFMETINEGKYTSYKTTEYYKTNKSIFKTESIWKDIKQRRFQRDSVEETRHLETLSYTDLLQKYMPSEEHKSHKEGQDLHNLIHIRKETLKDNSNLFILRRKRSVIIPIANKYTVTPNVQMTTSESLVTMKALPKTVSMTPEVQMTTESSVPVIAVSETALVIPEVQMTTKESEITRIALTTFICSGSMSNFVLLDFNGVENNITYMDISGNQIPKLNNSSFTGLSRLVFLNLSSNQIASVDCETFAPLQSLIYLDLSNNQLQNSVNKTITANWFETLFNLQVLNISKNSITYLPPTIFQTLHHVKVLDLSMNDLNDFNLNLVNLTELQILDLSGNHLSCLEVHIMNHMDNVANNHIISLDLSGNKLFCTCKTLPFLHWIKETKVNLINKDQYYCSLDNGIVHHLNQTEFLRQLEESCKSYVMVYISTAIAVTFILASISFFLIYKYRWKLRYLYHMAKLKLPTKPINNAVDAFIYDGFICYAEDDVLFVKNCIIPELEVNRGQKLLVNDRDILPGEVLTTAILKAIRESRKTVLLISRASLKNKWWIFEMHMAQMESIHTKRDVLIAALLENIPSKDLPLDVLSVLQSCPFIEYPNDNHAQTAFWIKLHGYLNER